MTLQTKLNDLKYPPTQIYELEGLKPDEFLKKRLDGIDKLAPEFFKGNDFLDIGIGKGFFTFYASKKFKQCTGIEPELKSFNLCKEIKDHLGLKNVLLQNCSFQHFCPAKLYDRVFIGNCMHYLYKGRLAKKKEGWTWVNKIASLMVSGGILIIEAPLDGKENSDIKYLADDPEYTKEYFTKIFSQFFDILEIVNSPSKYRYMIKLIRKSNPLQNIYPYENLKKVKSLDPRPDRETFITSEGDVCKIFSTQPSYRFLVQTAAVSYLPTRAKLKGIVLKEGMTVGIIQEYLGEKKSREVNKSWDLYQKDQEMLLQLGCVDVDWGIVNIISNKIVDVGSICPLSCLIERSRTAFARNIRRDYLKTFGEKACNDKINFVNSLNEKYNGGLK